MAVLCDQSVGNPVLALAANTSFGGLPVLMQLLAKDHRLPHLFPLRAERPVFRYGVATLGVLAAAVLLVVDAHTHRLLPVFAIGVFIGFTISQPDWSALAATTRPRWVGKAVLNGTGAVLTAVAGVVLFASKFTEGAWLLRDRARADAALRSDRTLLPSRRRTVGSGQIRPNPFRSRPATLWSSSRS